MTRQTAGANNVRTLVARLGAAVDRRNRGARDLALVGIKRRGVPLAERIAAWLANGRTGRVPVGAMDITLYRDDLQLVAETPIVRGSEITFDINGRTLVLVDDVIFTGRTIRAALTELLDFGRPRAVQLAVLVDRGHRELPIQPDFVGRKLKTSRADLVDIFLKETDGRDEIVLTRTGRSQRSRVRGRRSK
jgi:pyrimidine operon attenuation protein/uracil phosphoribosyltransferase